MKWHTFLPLTLPLLQLSTAWEITWTNANNDKHSRSGHGPSDCIVIDNPKGHVFKIDAQGEAGINMLLFTNRECKGEPAGRATVAFSKESSVDLRGFKVVSTAASTSTATTTATGKSGGHEETMTSTALSSRTGSTSGGDSRGTTAKTMTGTGPVTTTSTSSGTASGAATTTSSAANTTTPTTTANAGVQLGAADGHLANGLLGGLFGLAMVQWVI